MVERGQGRPILWLHGEDGLDPAAPVLDLLAAHGSVQAPSHPWYGRSPDSEVYPRLKELERAPVS